MPAFGNLERVGIRDGWPSEPSDFTPWLAETDNLNSLGKEIGIDLDLIAKEVSIGSYFCDILAKRAGTEDTVVIENQFGSTDHKHLGQLLTYAAGVGADGAGAKTIVWIAEQFSEPHRAALDWLNKCTEPGIRFFGVEIQLWRIRDSAYAPKFDVVCRPNNWQKQLTQDTGALSATSQLYRNFWDKFTEFCGHEGTTLQLPSDPRDNSVMPNPISRGFSVHLMALKKGKEIRCKLFVDHPRKSEARELLLKEMDGIATKLGSRPEINVTPIKYFTIFQSSSGDIANCDEWPAMHRWLKDRGEAYVAVFTPPRETVEIGLI